jgi:tetratricopeptide (TPR) repeat protein
VHEIRHGVEALEARAKADPKLLFPLVRHHITLGDFGKAYEVLIEVVRLKPDDAGTHQALGECLLMLGRAAEAIVELDLAMRMGLTGFRKYAGYCCRGHAQLLLKNFGAALRDVDEALLLFPKAEGAQVLRNQILESEAAVPGLLKGN